MSASSSNDPSDRSDLDDPNTPGDYARWALYARWLEHDEPAIRANALRCLIHQANYLLDQQLLGLEQDFIESGGYSEQLAAARIAERQRRKNHPSDPSDPSDRTDPSNRTDHQFPMCPLCGKLMALRKARQGKSSGSQFWGCTAYPECKGTLPIDSHA